MRCMTVTGGHPSRPTAAKILLPDLAADQDDGVGACRGVVGFEASPEQRVNPQQAMETGRHPGTSNGFHRRADELWYLFPAKRCGMKAFRHGALCRIGAVVVGLAAMASCASVGGSSAPRSTTFATTETSRKTQQEVQSDLMAFSDRYFAATLEAAKILESVLETPDGRYMAAAARMIALVTATDIAASPNPGGALLDMTVFVTLRRMVWEEYWMREVYGDAGQPVLDILLELEDDIWGIAAGVYSQEQLSELRELIHDWRSAHPDVRAVDFMRMTKLGDSRQVKKLFDAGLPGGMLAPVKEANRELEEMRLLAERLTFLVTRMQLLVSLQLEMGLAKVAVQPEVRQLLEDSRTFAEVSDRFAEAFATLVADLPEERRAAIDQVLSGLRVEREQILAELTAEDGDVRSTLGDFRDTFESGRLLAEKLNETVESMDALVARMLEGDPARPFDIMDYKATVEEATKTVQEFQIALTTIERIMGSTLTEEDVNSILEGANRLEDEVVDEIIDRAFLRGVALIIVFFIILTLYRLLIRRFAPDLAWKQKAGQ